MRLISYLQLYIFCCDLALTFVEPVLSCYNVSSHLAVACCCVGGGPTARMLRPESLYWRDINHWWSESSRYGCSDIYRRKLNRLKVQGLLVQSIVSLTMSLRRQLVKYMPTTLSNKLLFLLEKCENLNAKDSRRDLFFQQKNNSVHVFVIFTFST